MKKKKEHFVQAQVKKLPAEKQAIAIGLSEARKAGAKVPRKKS